MKTIYKLLHQQIFVPLKNNFYSTFVDKNYENAEEEEMRKMIFSANLKKIEMHNYLHAKGLKNFKLGVNEYADLVS